ncbi:MAG: CapA family protein [Cystobacterineae bacterium]|nr:CapA family protein [Cystobacterineae bacterium]
MCISAYFSRACIGFWAWLAACLAACFWVLACVPPRPPQPAPLLETRLEEAPPFGVEPTPEPEGWVAHPTLRIRAVGDVMLGTDFPEGYLPPDNANILQGVKALLGAEGRAEGVDVVFANLEGPLCNGGETTKCAAGGRCYAFRMPGPYVHHLKEAGINVVSTANNHSGDFGEECSRQTEAFLDAAGIAWSGSPGSVAFLQRHGRRVAVLAFHTSPRTNNLNNLPEALALLAQAKREAHWVVVSFHGGAEGALATRVPQGKEIFLKEDRGNLRLFARSMIEAGAHLVLGHGPHVLRGMELWKGKLIAYSLGNFATYGRFGLAGPLGIGAVLEVVLDEEGNFREGQVFSTKQVDKGFVLPDAEGKAFVALRQLSALDFPHTGLGIGLDGKLYKNPLQALPALRVLPAFLAPWF